MSTDRPRLLFVTGKLAAPALEREVRGLGERLGFEGIVHVAKISVAALITPDWLIGKLTLPEGTTRVILPGLSTGPVDRLSAAIGTPVDRGPADLRDLARYFQQSANDAGYGDHDIEILAEINHADTLTTDALLAEAERLRRDGTDFIDLGCSPGRPWTTVADAVKRLRDQGFRVSIDSFDPNEVAGAVKAGAKLVLSVNTSNREQAPDWGAEVVVIPDQHSEPAWADELAETAEYLDQRGVRFRLDPILEPIGFGFAASLERYLQTRRRFPAAEIMMGVGNLTELTQVDSAGVNALLIGFCQELGIRSVLTTEVINWARSSVKEIAILRELMFHAVNRGVVPKNVDDRLPLLRDARLRTMDDEELARLAAAITDPNFRLFAEGDRLIVMSKGLHLESDDPFSLFEKLGVTDPSHAFYLGWEMMKASLALQLGKNYAQDQALRFGFLTKEETSHRSQRTEVHP